MGPVSSLILGEMTLVHSLLRGFDPHTSVSLSATKGKHSLATLQWLVTGGLRASMFDRLRCANCGRELWRFQAAELGWRWARGLFNDAMWYCCPEHVGQRSDFLRNWPGEVDFAEDRPAGTNSRR